MNLTLAEENAALRQKIEDQERLIAELMAEPPRQILVLQNHFGVTPQQAKFLFLLSTGEVKGGTWLAARCCKRDSHRETIKTIASYVRNRTGLIINSRRAVGYWLDGESLSRVQGALA